MPKGKGYPKKGKKGKKVKTLPIRITPKKKGAIANIKDRAKRNRDALNFE